MLDTKNCPYCLSQVPRLASVCSNCGAEHANVDVDGVKRKWEILKDRYQKYNYAWLVLLLVGTPLCLTLIWIPFQISIILYLSPKYKALKEEVSKYEEYATHPGELWIRKTRT
ncbi:hypothetical protein HT665_06245 [Ursidibacter maritimus]|uniref:Uncharacterized protein n=1 Tax=Ursidibacter maritimus TaxID=1331689 RepID=A0A949T0G2_9PAST|nr:hypothetical protein [Ursidibacter maritimus]KAE9540271.1 hypothetical protein A1D26_00895 [Ursidibacter maritimus]MBV6524168.1 hypothetical protein [Ursidibacter maritimus]MBV6525652.1 hypothetical protein [Ursidibacter maritimus]MBV6528141.1 hypothetical protein [Ursidibacter maritimus]MBV6528961.1 hypothetical protein [Ursidibacter maritimus]